MHYLTPRGKAEVMIDLTLGEGGHSLAFLSKNPDLSLICTDADKDMLNVAKERLAPYHSRVQFFNCWAQDFLASYPKDLPRPNTIFGDLGISLYHYSKSGKGFSFSADETLDMRLDNSCGITAAELLAQKTEKEIADILYRNGGERFAKRISRAIVKERQHSGIKTSAALADLVKRSVPASYRYGHIHPATRTFLALRIFINGELTRLPQLLEGALKILKPGGRLGIISFHSLEDRIVKNFFKMKNKDCICPAQAPSCTCEGRRTVNILTKKGITPNDEEINRNPPSRSARLRVVEKIKEAA